MLRAAARSSRAIRGAGRARASTRVSGGSSLATDAWSATEQPSSIGWKAPFRHDPATHRVVALAFDGVEPFDLSSVAEVFTSTPVAGHYAFAIAAVAQPVSTTHGYQLAALAGPRAIERADTLVVAGFVGRPHADGLKALRRAARRGTRLISICTGAFALAEAGALDGCPATTHWLRTDELTSRFPAVDVRPDVLFVDDGDVLSSAGTAAGLDLCLHVVRRDLGATIANEVARRLVVAPHRDGGQAQYVERPVPAHTGRLAATRLGGRSPRRQPRCSAMARRANLSLRHFARLFVAETGTTPHRWLTEQRLLRARRLLEATGLSIDEVATLSGFNTTAALREHFRRPLDTSPTAYRRVFQGHAPPALRSLQTPLPR